MEQESASGYAVIAAGTTILALLGVAYAWGVYVDPLIVEFGWTKTAASLPFSLFLLFYTGGMLLGGVLQDRFGPRPICTVGALLFGVGYLLSAWADSLVQLALTYGVVGGIGTGLAYIPPVTAVVKWFPRRPGLMAGIVVLGFGIGASFLSPLAEAIILARGWRTSFLSLGIAFLAVLILAAQWIRLPRSKAPVRTLMKPAKTDLAPRAVLRTRTFWLAWGAWVLSLTAGLGLMGHMVSFAVAAEVPIMAAASLLSAIAVANGIGRIVMGAVSDQLGRMRVLSAASATAALVFLALTWARELWILYSLGALFGLSFGTWLVLYPTVAVQFFGARHLGANYGLLFSSYGVGGLLGPLLFGWSFDSMGSYTVALWISTASLLLAAILAVLAATRTH